MQVSQIRKLNSLHYRILRLATGDWRIKTKRSELDKLGRVKPMQFARYSTAGLVIKTIRNNKPRNLSDILQKTLYCERRKPGRLRFFDNSKTKLGFQSIDNRLTSVFAELDFDHYPHITDHSLRINLKKSLNLNKHDPILQNDERKVIRATQITTS